MEGKLNYLSLSLACSILYEDFHFIALGGFGLGLGLSWTLLHCFEGLCGSVLGLSLAFFGRSWAVLNLSEA